MSDLWEILETLLQSVKTDLHFTTHVFQALTFFNSFLFWSTSCNIQRLRRGKRQKCPCVRKQRK